MLKICDLFVVPCNYRAGCVSFDPDNLPPSYHIFRWASGMVPPFSGHPDFLHVPLQSFNGTPLFHRGISPPKFKQLPMKESYSRSSLLLSSSPRIYVVSSSFVARPNLLRCTCRLFPLDKSSGSFFLSGILFSCFQSSAPKLFRALSLSHLVPFTAPHYLLFPPPESDPPPPPAYCLPSSSRLVKRTPLFSRTA